MSSAQLLDSPLAVADLDVTEDAYFGNRLSRFGNKAGWPFFPEDGPLTRTSYVYQAVYKIGSGKDKEYGGIQIRARVHTYGDPPGGLREWLKRTAHRAAYMYDSGIQTAGYAPRGGRGTQSGDGYLSGFNAVESYQNYERERISPREMHTSPGVVDWSTEVYTDDSFADAYLSGIAQGLSFPYEVDHRTDEGRPPVDVAPHKWGLSWNGSRNDGKGQYDVHPPGNRKARKRYQPGGAAHGKAVYINEKPVGGLDSEGRTWLTPEYAGNPNKSSGSWGTYWSREGLVDKTGATYQALRDGGTLYLTGETTNGIYLVTAAEKPPGYEPVDPDDVSADVVTHEGTEPVDVHLLKLQDPAESLRCEARRDDNIIKHMGRSNPRYTHLLGEGQSWTAVRDGPGARR